MKKPEKKKKKTRASTGPYENMNSQLTSLPMCGFIAQLVEHRTGPVEALFFFFFFQASSFQLLKLEIHCEDHISPSYISAVHI